MENVLIVDGTQFGESNGVEEEATESITEKEALTSSDDSKGSEGDGEEFEEAVQGETPRIVDSEVRIDGEENEDSALADEVDKFEEAVATPSHEEKEDVFVTDESSSHEDIGNQLDGLADNGIAPDEKEKFETPAGENGAQVSDEVIQVSKKSENGDLDHVGLEESWTHDTSDKVVSEQQGNLGYEPLGTQDANEVKGGGGDTGPEPGIEANDVNIHQEEKHDANEMKGGGGDTVPEPVIEANHVNIHQEEKHDANEMKGGGGDTVPEPVIEANDVNIHQEEKHDANEMKGGGGDTCPEPAIEANDVNIQQEEKHDANEVKGVGGDTGPELGIEANLVNIHQEEKHDANEVKGGGGDIGPEPGIEANDANIHQEDKHVEVNETGSIDVGLMDKPSELENTSTGLFSVHQDSLIEHQKDNPDKLDDEIKGKELQNVAGRDEDDGEEHEAIQVHSAIAAEQDEENHEPESKPLAERNAETPAESTCEQARDITADMLPDNSQSSSNELAGVSSVVSEPVVQEPESKDKSEEVSQTILLNKAEVMDAKASEAVVFEPENKDNNEVNGEVNQRVSQSKEEQEFQPATTMSKSGGICGTPAGLAHSALGVRERQRTTENKEDRARPVADTSSSSNRSATTTPASSRPAGLGRAAPLASLLEPAPRAVQQPRVNGSASPVQNQLVEDPTNGEGEETDETREKLQMIRVKFLRLAHRLGQTPHNVVVAQVLYRLGLAEQLRGRNGSRAGAFSFDRASAMAEQLEAAGQGPLDFSCTIMVLGKTGVGKSATINSIFDEIKFDTDAFQLGTKKVQDVVGTVQGIKVRVIDTPGLLPSWSDQRKNEKILHSVKQYIKRTPPDIVLYLDRLDMPSREFGDMPLLRTITDIFGPSIWFNAIVVLTHAASAPPEGPNGVSTSYDMFVTQRSQVVQQAIRLAAGDVRLMNPVSLVENHSACRTNRAGQRVLPNGQVWKPHLLLLSFASKILAEANTLLKLQDSPPGKPFVSRTRSPPIPFLLSSLLQSRPPVKLPFEQYGTDDDTLDDELDGSSDSEDESEYDELPPFKRLTKAQLAELPKNQRKAYYDELEYREKLFMKKQLKEEKKRRKMMKKMQAAADGLPTDYSENVEEESAGVASVPVVMPDLALPASFDSDNPTHRYRYIDSSNQWLVRPVLETNGWDHDVGYEGINAERLFVVKDKIPISFSGQVSKDKKDANLQMEVASTVKHGEGKATSLGFDLQSVGKDFAYTFRSETRFSNWKKNKAVAGLSTTLLGDILTCGLKIEDKLIINEQGQLVASAGAIVARGDVAYGGSFEATFRDKDPLGRFLSTLGLSVMDWHGELAIGWNFQSQIPVGRTTNLIGRVNVNNRGSGQVSIRINSSEHLQIALISLIPLVRKLLCHSQPMQFG